MEYSFPKGWLFYRDKIDLELVRKGSFLKTNYYLSEKFIKSKNNLYIGKYYDAKVLNNKLSSKKFYNQKKLNHYRIYNRCLNLHIS